MKGSLELGAVVLLLLCGSAVAADHCLYIEPTDISYSDILSNAQLYFRNISRKQIAGIELLVDYVDSTGRYESNHGIPMQRVLTPRLKLKPGDISHAAWSTTGRGYGLPVIGAHFIRFADGSMVQGVFTQGCVWEITSK